MLLALMLAFLAGVTRTVGRMISARLAERIGVFQSTFYTYALGLICSLLAVLLSGAHSAAAQGGGPIPLWGYAGGAVGVLFVALSNLTTPRISAVTMALLIFVGQIGAGIAIDMAARQQFAPGSIVGGLLILAGLLGNLRADRRRAAE